MPLDAADRAAIGNWAMSRRVIDLNGRVMLLSLTSTTPDARELGYLLHKHPDRSTSASAEHLDRLRRRGLGRKSALARREFALGIEALDRFVANEHLHRVDQCVLGVLALESELVDSRL